MTKSLAQLAKENKKRLKREKNASPALHRATDQKTPSSPLAPTNLSLDNPKHESDSDVENVWPYRHTILHNTIKIG